MNTKQNNGLNRRRGMGHLALIGVMILSASLAAGAEDLSAWQKRMPIAFSGYTPTGGCETLTNFPVLVILSNTAVGAGFAYSDFQSPPYGDLRFAVADKKTQLDFEVESWDTNGNSYVWVQAPLLVDTNTKIYAIWGKRGVSASACTTNGGAWINGFNGVWHLGLTSATQLDSTTNSNHATPSGGVVTDANGKVARAVQLNGVNGQLSVPHHASIAMTDNFTAEVWFKRDTYGVFDGFLSKETGPFTKGWSLVYNNNSPQNFAAYIPSAYRPCNATGVQNDFAWHHFVLRIRNGYVNLFLDGVQQKENSAATMIDTGKAMVFGKFDLDANDHYLNGALDEIRMSSVPRSSNWVWASYMTMASNDVFAVYGIPQFQDYPAVETSGWTTNVTSSSAWLNGTLSSTGTSDTAMFAYWGLTDGGTNASAWANTNIWAAPQAPGNFTIEATDLAEGSTYYYRFAASNAAGLGWAVEASVFITGEVWIKNTAEASENGPTPGTFTVHRASAVTNEALTVAYIVGGTATPDADYTALSGTVTIPKGEQATTIEMLPVFDHLIEGPETVVVTLEPGPYVLGIVSNATVEIADYGVVTRTWGGGGAVSSFVASDAANWVEGEVPIAGNAIILDARTAKNMTWDLNLPVQSWTQDGYMGTVTVQTAYPGQGAFTNFTIVGDCIISNGVWSPGTDTATGKYWLYVTVGGAMTVGADAMIDATARGLRWGPGRGANAVGGTHGGKGASKGAAIDIPGPCYGSAVAPTNLGSGGTQGTGGGAIRIQVGGSLRVDGFLQSNGSAQSEGTGSGGSVFLTVGEFSGAGTIRVNGGNASNHSPGGGGRVSLIVTNDGAGFMSFTGSVEALSGLKVNGGYAAPGTVYLETAADGTGRGRLVVDPQEFVSTSISGLGELEPASYDFGRILLTNGVFLLIGSNTTLVVSNTVMEMLPPNTNNGLICGGGTLVVPESFTFSNLSIRVDGGQSTFAPVSLTIGTNAVLVADQPLTLPGDLIVAAGGRLTHSLNGTLDLYRLRMVVEGDMTVETNGLVEVDGKGYRAGPGLGIGSVGGSYGGQGGPKQSGQYPGICYGSITTPIHFGSGGTRGTGGGAIHLEIVGRLRVDGAVQANGEFVSEGTGSGGSVLLTVGALSGTGAIRANGGLCSNHSPGGGGRVSVAVTNSGALFADFEGVIEALSGVKTTAPTDAYYAGAGTVYLLPPGADATEGLLIVDNNDLKNTRFTQISSTVTECAVRNVVLRRNASLLLDTGQIMEVSGSWSNGASFNGLAESAVCFMGGSESTSTVYGATVFTGLICTNAGKTLVFTAGTTNHVGMQGRLWLRGNAASPVRLRSSNEGAAWKLNVDSSVDQMIECVDVADSDASGAAEVTAINSVNSDRNRNWRFESVLPGQTLIWTGDSNTVWSSRGNWNLDRAPLETDRISIPAGRLWYPVLDADRTLAALDMASGSTLALNGYDLTVTGTVAMAGRLISSGNETIVFKSAAALSGTVTASGTERFRFEGDADFTGGIVEPALSTLFVEGATAQTLNLGGATFYKVFMNNDADTVTLSGGFTATELRCEAPSGARSLAFEAGKRVTLRNLVLRGATGTTNILITSTMPGSKWNLAVSGYRSVRGVEIHDSDARPRLPIPARDSEDGGGNENWTFDVVPALWLGGSGNNFHTAANWNPAVVPDAATRVLVESSNPMTITGTVSMLALTVGGGLDASTVTVQGTLTVGENVMVLDKGTLVWNCPGVVSNGLYVLEGGVLTHTANTTTEDNKLDLTILKDSVVDVGGTVEADGKGYTAGPGRGIGAVGGTHGGQGGPKQSGQYPGPSYGSVIAPTNMGSGGTWGYGGGAILMRIGGVLRVDGCLRANGGGSSEGSGSGGSVNLIVGALSGVGAIQANGGNVTGHSAGGGGRVAIVVTNTGADTADFAGEIRATSGALLSALVNAMYAGAGTVYLQSSGTRMGGGTVRVENDNLLNTLRTPLPPFTNAIPEETRRAVFHVSHGARLHLTNDFAVGDIWLDTANAVLDLGSNTLTVNTREHPFGLVENVINPGTIIWTGLPPGVLIIVK